MNGEYPSNSNKKRPPEEKLESVVVNKVVAGKKPLGKRMRDVFFAGDGRGAANSVISDVIIPQIKDMAAEAVKEVIERLLFGDRGYSHRRSGPYRPSTPTHHTNYSARYSGRPHTSRPPIREDGPNASLRTDDIEYIVLGSRNEAYEVLDRMNATIEKYEKVSIADLKSLINWSADLADQDWGWENLEHAQIRKERNGFSLNLPKPQPLD